MSESQAESTITTEKNTDESEVLPHYIATIRSQKAIQSLSFIQSLSDDLLFDIFSISVVYSNSTNSNPPIQFILSIICRRWRDIVIYSPLLWTHIFFPTNSKYDTLIFFERSYPAPINVSFDSVSCFHVGTVLPRFTEALKKHISRLRSLTVLVREITDMRELWGSLESIETEALHLQTLSVQLFQSTCDETTDYDRVPRHTPLWRGGGLARSMRVVGLCLHCLPLFVGLTKLEIGYAALNYRDLQTLLNNYPSLSTLVIGRFGTPIHDFDTLPPDQVPHSAQVLAPALRSLAIHIDDSHSADCTCALPWFVMDKLEYLEIMFSFYTSSTHHASILTRLKSVPLLRKLRIYGLAEHCLTSVKTFFSSLPKSVDLEFVYYPESSRPALSEILALPYFRSIAFDLTSRRSSRLGHFLSLDEFCEEVSRTELKSPIIVHLPTTKNTLKLDTTLGNKLSIHTFPSEKGLLEDFLAPDIEFGFDYDEDEDEDDLEHLDYEVEDVPEDEFGDEDEDEDEDRSEGNEFPGGPQGLYASGWLLDVRKYIHDNINRDWENLGRGSFN